MKTMIEVIKYFISIGAVGILLKFIADRIFSTEIERALETNYQKIIRGIFDYILTVIYMLFMILMVMFTVTNFQNKNEQSNTFQLKEEQTVSDKKDDKNDSNEKGNYNEFIALVLFTSILCAPTLYLFKDINNKYFRRLVYEEQEQGDFLVVKKISKNKVLMKKINPENASEQEIYAFKKFDDLDKLVLESFEDRKKRRVMDLHEVYNLFKNKKASFAIIVMVLILYIVILLTMKQWTVLIAPTAIILTFWLYLYNTNKLFERYNSKTGDSEETQS